MAHLRSPQRGPRLPHGTRRACVIAFALCATLSSGCTTAAPPDAELARATQALAAALMRLPGSPDPTEAHWLATVAIDTTAALRPQYRPLKPPLLGNSAFKLGFRERALCCHWARDLLHALSVKPLEHFALHWGVARHGELREHSAVVVVPAGARFAQGLVLDAWRNSGRLHWAPVQRDAYPWELHPLDEQRMRIRCRAR